jgi:hypothetical protein
VAYEFMSKPYNGNSDLKSPGEAEAFSFSGGKQRTFRPPIAWPKSIITIFADKPFRKTNLPVSPLAGGICRHQYFYVSENRALAPRYPPRGDPHPYRLNSSRRRLV